MGCEWHFPAWLLSSRKSVLLPTGREVGKSSSQDKGATGGRWELWEASWNHRAQVGALGNKSELQGVRWKPREAGGSPREQVEAPENRWEAWETKRESQRTGGQDPLSV